MFSLKPADTVMSWSELVPPMMVIFTSLATELFFNEDRLIRPIVEPNLPDNAPDSVVNNLTSDFSNVALGWQTIIDSLNAFLGAAGLIACRLLDGRFNPSQPTTWAVLLLAVVNALLLGLSCQGRLVDVAGSPFYFFKKQTLSRRFTTLRSIVNRWVVWSNAGFFILLLGEKLFSGS